ncbi:MAG: hypothetical protein ACO1G9_11135 [Bacteroidota bacterium]
MKLKLKFLAIVLLFTTVAMGQRHENAGKNLSPEERAQKRAETLKAKLQLTDVQYNEVYTQLVSNEKRMQAQRDEMKKAREDHDAKMKSILTPEQYSQLKEMQTQRREMMKGKRNRAGQSDEMPKE